MHPDSFFVIIITLFIYCNEENLSEQNFHESFFTNGSCSLTVHE